jgi:uncharacterized protein YbaP (TraB family)
MRRASILVFLAVALLAPGGGHAAANKSGPPPACAGRDIFSAMKRSDPEGYARIRAAADAVPNTGALLWRIDGKGQPPSYLFGTIHSTDERVHKLSPAVVAAFDAASTVALEYLESQTAKSSLEELIADKGTYANGNGLKDVLTAGEIDTLRRTLAVEGLPADAVHVLRPWLAVFMLAMPPCEKRRADAGLASLDQRIERDAIAQGKRVAGLETFAFQIDAVAGMPEAVQVGLLKATVGTIHLRNDALEAMHRAYLRRDLATSVPFSKRLAERAGYDPSPLDTFERDIGTRRNYGMRDAALPLLEAGGAFIAVGALHLLGKDGLIELFRAAGYTVTPIE